MTSSPLRRSGRARQNSLVGLLPRLRTEGLRLQRREGLRAEVISAATFRHCSVWSRSKRPTDLCSDSESLRGNTPELWRRPGIPTAGSISLAWHIRQMYGYLPLVSQFLNRKSCNEVLNIRFICWKQINKLKLQFSQGGFTLSPRSGLFMPGWIISQVSNTCT